MNNLKEFSPWSIGVTSEHPVNFYVDHSCLKAGEGLNIAYLIEPEEVIAENFYKDIIELQDKFKYILTDKEEILNTCSNAVLFEYGTSWMPNNPHIEKTYGVSTVIGFKQMVEGHLMRQELWKRRSEILIPQFFYASQHGGPALEEDHYLKLDDYNRDQLFKTQFHIVIENKQTKYWFTEKLCDCFNSRVVPIYYGAKEIGNFFDTSGMLIVNNLDELITVTNWITESTYSQMQDSISINEMKVKKYNRLGDRLTEKMKELLG